MVENGWGPKAAAVIAALKSKYGGDWETKPTVEERRHLLDLATQEWIEIHGTDYLKAVSLKTRIEAARLGAGTGELDPNWEDYRL